MPRLALLRHGPTRWTAEHRLQGRSDLPLSAEGRRAVGRWQLEGRLAGFAWITSPLRRARETAALLGHREAAVDERLTEMSFGAWEGRRVAELREELGARMAALEARGLDFRPPGGESPREVQARLEPLLREIGRGGRDCAAVTHKSVIRAVYSLASGWPMLGRAPDRLAGFALHLYAVGADGAPRIERLNLPLEAG